MDREELEECKFKIIKLKQLRKEYAGIKPKVYSDTVKGSSKIIPYAVHTITITGNKYMPNQKKQKKILKNQINILEKEIKNIEYRIKQIPNKEVSQIILYRYIYNFSWYKIQILMEYASESKAKMKLKRFFKKNKKI